jgi:hypothetical protein
MKFLIILSILISALQSTAFASENEMIFGNVKIKLVDTSSERVPILNGKSGGGWQPQTMDVFREFLGLISDNNKILGCQDPEKQTYLKILNSFVAEYANGVSDTVDISLMKQIDRQCLLSLKTN